MVVKIAELMTHNVVTVHPHETVGHVRTIFKKNSISTIPVVDTDNQPVGIVSVSDLVSDASDTTPVSSVMTSDVYTVPQYNDVEMAARIMRNHKIHHVVVTHEKSIVGVISSFDLLKLVEGRRFVMKQAGTPGKSKGKRGKAEASDEN